MAALALILAASPTAADVCAWVDRGTADRAAEIIREAGTLLAHDWFRPTKVGTVDVRRDDSLYQVVVNGDQPLDLAYVYLPDGATRFRNLGRRFECVGDATPERIPNRPFLPPDEAAPWSEPPWRPDPDRHPAPTHPGLIGLLELPALAIDGDGEIAVLAAPDPAASITLRLADFDKIPAAEFGYETPGAIVLERREGWYRIALDRGVEGWIAVRDAGGFHTYPELVAGGMAYLTARWPGDLYAKAGDAAPERTIAAAWRRKMGGTPSVEVTGIARANDRLWFKISLGWPDPCSGETAQPVAEGWVPAYDTARRPTVWFYSRGC